MRTLQNMKEKVDAMEKGELREYLQFLLSVAESIDLGESSEEKQIKALLSNTSDETVKQALQSRLDNLASEKTGGYEAYESLQAWYSNEAGRILRKGITKEIGDNLANKVK